MPKYVVKVALDAFPSEFDTLGEFLFPTGGIWAKMPFLSVANMALSAAEEFIREFDPQVGTHPAYHEGKLDYAIKSPGKTYLITYHKDG